MSFGRTGWKPVSYRSRFKNPGLDGGEIRPKDLKKRRQEIDMKRLTQLFATLSYSLALVALVTAGCASLPSQAPAGGRTPTPGEVVTPTPAESEGEVIPRTDTESPGTKETLTFVAPAVEDLADRLGAPAEEIQVQSVEAETWPDAGLGCPQPGKTYAQVLTPGFRLLLAHEGETYEYHTDQAERFVYCGDETMTEKTTPIGEIEPGLETFIRKAKEDLSQRFSIEAEQIEVLEARSVVWPDTSMGCPQPGMMYTQVLQDGVRIHLKAGDQVYAYHGGGARDLFLCEQPGKTPGGTLEVPPSPSMDQ
jgi:hypothetical protein